LTDHIGRIDQRQGNLREAKGLLINHVQRRDQGAEAEGCGKQHPNRSECRRMSKFHPSGAHAVKLRHSNCLMKPE
jgi:hypothetical protein